MSLPDFYNADLLFDTKPDERGNPFVTVCLSVYKFERTVLRAINTLLEQTYRDFEIVISDDMSPDNSVDIVMTFLKTYSGDVRIRLYRAKENGGVVRNRLRGMFFGRGEIFVQADGDDFSMPKRLERTVSKWLSLKGRASILVTNGLHYYEEESRAGEAVLKEGMRVDYPPADPVEGAISNFSAGFVVSRGLFETFKHVDVPQGLMADDPVLARRSLLLHGMHVDLEPLFYYGTSVLSTSGGGVSGKKWIIDRYNRWCLLEKDIKVLRELTSYDKKRLEILKKRMLLDARLIDCSILVWPFFWIRMWFISGNEAKAALKKRIKLILTGSVNGSLKWRK